MSRICHEHCPDPGHGPWLLLAITGLGVWAVAQVLTAAGKTVLTAVLAAVLAATITVIVAGIRGSIRSARSATAAGATAPTPVPAPQPEPTPAINLVLPPSPPARPRLRIVRDDERAA